MTAVVTGSRAYGDPRPDSDVDLVVLCSEVDIALLRELADGQEAGPRHPSGGPDDASLRFGRLNLIAVASPKRFEQWRLDTALLRLRAEREGRRLTREEAVGFMRLRDRARAEEA